MRPWRRTCCGAKAVWPRWFLSVAAGKCENSGRGSFSFRQPGLSAARAEADGGLLSVYRVRMGSGDTEYYQRDEWLLIPWFYVTVLLDLERP